jgi:hypothetical protein
MSASEMENATSTTAPAKQPEKKKMNPAIIAVILLVGCGGGAIGGIVGGLSSSNPIKGTWVSPYGSYVTITDTYWYSVASWGSSAYEIDSNSGGVVIMQNPSSDAYNPDKWSKIEYVTFEGTTGWAQCTSVYDADTAAAALSTDTSDTVDSTDSASGCNGFPFTTYEAYDFPIAGTWTTDWGSTLTITATEWASSSSWGDSTYTIEAYGANFVLMQNPADDAYNPSLWTLVQFHTVGDGFGYCMSVYNGATSAAALMTDTSSIYTSSNATAGCNGFSHTVASPA